MPNNTVQLNTELSPEQMARTKREADYINQKHKAAGKNYGESLGKDSFLKLLVTELTHQDPTKPMNDREFIAQMAQFSSLEQMNNVNSQMEQLNRGNRTTEAYSLIGKEIESLDAESGKPVRGEVSHVIRGENELYLAVGKHRVRLNDVHAVFPAAQKQPPPPSAHVPEAPQAVESAPPFVEEREADHITEMLPETQESTNKGMRNSFNHLNSIYDNNKVKYRKAQDAYLEQ